MYRHKEFNVYKEKVYKTDSITCLVYFKCKTIIWGGKSNNCGVYQIKCIMDGWKAAVCMFVYIFTKKIKTLNGNI